LHGDPLRAAIRACEYVVYVLRTTRSALKETSAAVRYF